MSKELVVSSNRHETRVAILEDDQLVEIYFQRGQEYSLAGSIHKGRVTRVLPGMQSAFVDLGLERDTFLYVSDFLEEHEDFDRVTGDERPLRRDDRPPRHQERRPAAPPSEQQPAPAAADAPEPEPEPDRAAAESTAVPIILPGESLAKYRYAAPPSPPVSTPASVELAEETEYDEPIHYPPENALPDAPRHIVAAEAAVEETATEKAPVEVPAPFAEEPPALVEPTMREPAMTEPMIAEPMIAEPSASEPAEEIEEIEHEHEAGPAVAPLLDEEEDLDIQAM